MTSKFQGTDSRTCLYSPAKGTEVCIPLLGICLVELHLTNTEYLLYSTDHAGFAGLLRGMGDTTCLWGFPQTGHL